MGGILLGEFSVGGGMGKSPGVNSPCGGIFRRGEFSVGGIIRGDSPLEGILENYL